MRIFSSKSKRKQQKKVQDMLAHKGRGTDLVFDSFYTDEIPGKLPNRAELQVRINVANEVAIFAMKGIAIGQRTKAKDYYDLESPPRPPSAYSAIPSR